MENKKHILYIDDDPVMRRLFGGQLIKKGFEVLYAKDGNEGREVARRLQPDLILLDSDMPIMNGTETASRLKSEEITKNIPIIFFTNQDLSIEAEKLIREVGVNDYVPKSADFSVLLDHVQKLLKI